MFDSFSSGMGGIGAMSTYEQGVHPMDTDTFGAQLVTRTLDTMNQDPFGSSTNSDYQFQKDVLSAAYSGVGALVNGNY